MSRLAVPGLALALAGTSCGGSNPAPGSAPGDSSDGSTARADTHGDATSVASTSSTSEASTDTPGAATSSDASGSPEDSGPGSDGGASTSDGNPTPGTIFESDFETEALHAIFDDVNAYGEVVVELSTDIAHSGEYSTKIVYAADEAGVELKVAPFDATPSLFVRKFEYFAPGWEGNWPVGLKTSRYFTRADHTTGEAPTASAYASEKLIWQTYDGDPDDLYARGANTAIFDLDLETTYPESTLFDNGLPFIRTGHWYEMETWMVLNSAVDAADGVLSVWIDDQLVYDLHDVVWKSSERGVPGGDGWQSMWFGGNYSGASFGGPSEPVTRYVDDVYLSTTLDR